MNDFDFVLKNGFVVDGTLKKPFKADVGVIGNKIFKIGKISSNKNSFDVHECFVVPGFIDMHSHSDFSLLKNPPPESKIRQGVTTEVIGNCGVSAAPITNSNKEFVKNKFSEKVKINWQNLDEYFKELSKKKLWVNVATLVGYANLKVSYNEDLLGINFSNLEEALRAGAFGVSIDLSSYPMNETKFKELVALGKFIQKFKSFISIHLRNEEDKILDSLKECLKIAALTGTSIEISHFKVRGKKNWKKFDKCLKLIDLSKQEGLNINFDVYPYSAAVSNLINALPTTLRFKSLNTLLKLFNNSRKLKALENLVKKQPKEFWKLVFVSKVFSNKNTKFLGKSIWRASVENKQSPTKIVLDILINDKLRTECIFHDISKQNLANAISSPHSIIASDAVARSKQKRDSFCLPHPRGFETFPKTLSEFVLDNKKIKLENAIHKMTYSPALKLNLQERGAILPGWCADLVVLDLKTLKNNATFSNPYCYPEGIIHVIVNGKFAILNGKLTKAHSGSILKQSYPAVSFKTREFHNV